MQGGGGRGGAGRERGGQVSHTALKHFDSC